MARGRKRATSPEPKSQPSAAPENGPTNERITEVLAEYTQLHTAGQRINQQKSSLLTNFEKEGGDRMELKALHRSMQLDPAEAAAKLARRIRYHAGQGITVKWQADGQGSFADTFGAAAPETPRAERPSRSTKAARDLAAAKAFSDGWNSGKSGAVPSDNPFSHAPGSEEYVSWHKGRDDGQADREMRRPDLADRLAPPGSVFEQLPSLGPDGGTPPAE